MAIVDALHAILSHAMREEPLAVRDDFYLRPYAVVEMAQASKKKTDGLLCPFEPSILQFKSYKVRKAHRVAVSILRKMGILDVTLQTHCDEAVKKRKWRAVPTQKLFVWLLEGNEGDDGYVKALEAMTGCPAPANWQEERAKAREKIMLGFTTGLKNLSWHMMATWM
jgi:hypothetical protein